MTVLPYDLAKALKEAGWPQDHGDGELVFADAHPYLSSGDSVYSPSLSELIEACPKEFWSGEFCLRIDGAKWDAGYYVVEGDPPRWDFRADGETTEEAVATLWLELKKEGKV